MLLFMLALILLVFVAMAWFFRHGLKGIDNPTMILEEKPLPKELAAVMKRLDKWKGEGRISREQYETFRAICLEDAAKEPPPMFH